MIVNVYAEKKKRGRKKKVVEEEIIVPQKKSINIDENIFNNSILTKREKMRMEKYGIIGYESVVDIFNNICLSKNLPNLTIYGDSGSGKSYLVNWLLAKLFKSHFKERVLYLSLNDERGIATMREKIKAFSNIQVKENPDIPNFKVIVFDQAEYISLDAQNALRRIIELSNNISRFIFLTRNTRCIIDPILSRCLQLNLNTHSQTVRVKKYIEFFPKINKSLIEEICGMYGNFGREISTLEILSNLTNEEADRFEIREKIISDKDCEFLFRLNENRETTMKDYVNFISEKMRGLNIRLSLDKIYKKLREKVPNLLKISSHFIDYEMSFNMDASDNVFLLQLLRNCALEKTEAL